MRSHLHTRAVDSLCAEPVLTRKSDFVFHNCIVGPSLG